MLLSRNDLISTLFRETDRAQRMKTPLAVIHCTILDWMQWRSKIGEPALKSSMDKVADRITRLLRCYDSVGQAAEGALLLVLPGCNRFNAVTMAERLNDEVFHRPVESKSFPIQFAACFGVAVSAGRSPFVVLQDAQRALQCATALGPGNVVCSAAISEMDPAKFLMSLPENLHLHG